MKSPAILIASVLGILTLTVCLAACEQPVGDWLTRTEAKRALEYHARLLEKLFREKDALEARVKALEAPPTKKKAK